MYTKHNYAAVDIAKFFFSICILVSHTGAYHEIPYSWYFQHIVLCSAVPFFFVTSGYFLGCKLYQNSNQSVFPIIKNYIRRLIYPYIVFSIINSIIASVDIYAKGKSVVWTFIFLAKAAIFYPYGALWYVWASIVASLLLYWFIKSEKIVLALFLGFICYLFALLCNSYYSLIENTVFQQSVDAYLRIATSARNGVFVGFLLLGIGIWLAGFGSRLQETKVRRFSWICLLFSLITLFLEVTYIKNKTVADDNSLFLSQLVMVPALLILLLNCEKIQASSLTLLLRQLSTGFYFIHRPLLSLLMNILVTLGYAEVPAGFIFFIILVLCLSICLPVYKHKTKTFYELLK